MLSTWGRSTGGAGPALDLNLAFPTGGVLDPRITFSRTTNATLTNSAGLVANAPMNLLTFSEQFDNAAWVKSNTAVTANTVVAPDGTTTADKLIANTTSIEHLCRGTLTLSATTHTLSVYAKAGEYSWVALTGVSFANAKASFNLSAGTVGTVSGSGSPVASISNAGNGWFRCVLTFTASASSASYGIAMANGNDSTFFAGDGVDGIYVWGAQLELGSTATTYNPTTVKNLLGFTEHFDNAAWTKSNASISATKVDDIYGQPFAQKLVESTANGVHSVGEVYTAASGSVVGLSVYLKAAERAWARITANTASGANASAYFNLSDGTVGTVNGGAASIVPAGNGWYRCAVIGTLSTANPSCSILIATGDNLQSYTGDGTSGIYIFGAQLSDSASVDPYVYQPVAAPSSVAYYGPRFDYDPVTLAPKGLLIEEQRTNLLPYSEAFDNAIWTKQGATISANASVAPDGSTTADSLVPSSGVNTFSGIYRAEATAAPKTISAYVKKGNKRWAVILGYNGTNNCWFDLDSGVTGTRGSSYSTSSIQDVGNGWYRIQASFSAAISTSTNLGIYASDSDNSTACTGDGSAVALYIWGAQLEAGAFATSYIPTVASQVTRAADSASMIGNNFARWYNATQGTLFAQFDTPASGNRPVLSVGDGTANNMIQLRTEATDPYFRVTTGGVAQAGLDVGTVAANTTYKMTGAYEANNFSACINAGVVGSDTSGTVSVVTRMLLGSDQAGSYLNGHISRAAAYGRVLAATEQQGVTA